MMNSDVELARVSRAKKRTIWAMGIAAAVALLSVFLFDGSGPTVQDRLAALLEIWILNVLLWLVVLWGIERARDKYQRRRS